MDIDHDCVPLYPPGLQPFSGLDVELSEETEQMDVDNSDAHHTEGNYIPMDMSSVPHTPAFIYSSAAPDCPMSDSWVQDVLDALDVVLGRLSVSPSEPSFGHAVIDKDNYDDYLDGASEDVDVPVIVLDVAADPTTPVRAAGLPVIVGLGVLLPGESEPAASDDSAASLTLEVDDQGLFSSDSDEAADAAAVEQLIDEELSEVPVQVKEPIVNFCYNVGLGDLTESGASVSEEPTLESGNHFADLDNHLAFAEGPCDAVGSVMLGDSLASDENTLVDATDDMDLKDSKDNNDPPAAPRKIKGVLRRYTEEPHPFKSKSKRGDRQVRFSPYGLKSRFKKRAKNDDDDLAKLLFQPGTAAHKKDEVALEVNQEPLTPTLLPSPMIKEEPVSPTISFCDNFAIDALAASLESTIVSEDTTLVNDVADAEGAEDKEDIPPPSPLARKGKGKVPRVLEVSRATHPFKARRAERRARFAPY